MAQVPQMHYICRKIVFMNVISLFLIGIGLSVDSLAASITTGAVNTRIQLRHALKVALFMAAFQALMPLVGWLIGTRFQHVVQTYDHWLAMVLLAGIGGKMIYEGLQNSSKNENCFSHSNHLMLAGMALATSIDALVIGIGFGLIAMNIWLAVLIIGLITFSFSATGIFLGKKLGTQLNSGIEIAGGIILIALGLKILISHLMF